MNQALYRKWRPRSWEAVVGQEHIVQTLRNAVRAGRVAHAYLFAGPRGTGKTTTARLLAKAVNCESTSLADRPCNDCDHCRSFNQGRYLDLIEIDAASNTSVEDVRDLRDKINFAPSEGQYKVYIIDEVHMLSTAAFNALLKTLEEPPAHAIFILATTEVHKIPATVLSRCQRHEFRRIPVDAMVTHLSEVLKQEGIQAETGVLELIARQATGSLRDAISLLDQLASAGVAVSLAQAQVVLGTAAGEAVRQVVDTWLRGDLGDGLTVINRTLDSGADPRQFARQIVDYLRGLLLIRMGTPGLVETTAEMRSVMEAQAGGIEVSGLLTAIRCFNRAASEARAGWQPSLPLEMAFLEAVRGLAPEAEFGPARPAAAVRPTKPPPAGRPAGNRQAEAPTQPDEPVGAPSPPAQAGSVSIQTVLDRWRDILGAVRKRDPRTQALLNSSRPLGLEGGVLILGFASDLLRDKMEKGHSLALVREALREVLGSEVEVRSSLAGGRVAPAGEQAGGAAVGDAGMVAAAMRDLGAQVVDVKPARPEDRRPDV